MLAGALRHLALTSFARREFALGLGYLTHAVALMSALYERFAAGEEIDRGHITPGYWPTLLLAHATNNEPVRQRFCNAFSLALLDRGAPSTDDSVYHARFAKALSERDVERAIGVGDERQPKTEAMFNGQAECMRAIAHAERQSFPQCLTKASTAWERYAGRHWKGLPDSVCFLNGVGLVRLAEHVWGERVYVDNRNIPGELLDDIHPVLPEIGMSIDASR